MSNYFSQGGNLNKPPFNDWYYTVPEDRNDTINYNLQRAYNLAPFEELENWRTASPEGLKKEENHLRSVYRDPKTDIYHFVKSKDHPTIGKELEFYNGNSKESKEFRENYDLDTSEKYYRYVPKNLKSQGGNLDPIQDLIPRQYRTTIGIKAPRLFDKGGNTVQDNIRVDNPYLNENYGVRVPRTYTPTNHGSINQVTQEDLDRYSRYEQGENLEALNHIINIDPTRANPRNAEERYLNYQNDKNLIKNTATVGPTVGGLIANPIGTVGGIAGGMAGDKLGRGTTEYIGGGETAQNIGGFVGGMVGSGIGYGSGTSIRNNRQARLNNRQRAAEIQRQNEIAEAVELKRKDIYNQRKELYKTLEGKERELFRDNVLFEDVDLNSENPLYTKKYLDIMNNRRKDLEAKNAVLTERPSKLDPYEKAGITKHDRTNVVKTNPVKGSTDVDGVYLVNRDDVPYDFSKGDMVWKTDPLRKTSHFTVDQSVQGHSGGSWDGRSETLITPYKQMVDKNGLPLNNDPMDTWFGNPNNVVVGRQGSKVLTGDLNNYKKYKSQGIDATFSKESSKLIKEIKDLDKQIKNIRETSELDFIGNPVKKEDMAKLNALEFKQRSLQGKNRAIVEGWLKDNKVPLSDKQLLNYAKDGTSYEEVSNAISRKYPERYPAAPATHQNTWTSEAERNIHFKDGFNPEKSIMQHYNNYGEKWLTEQDLPLVQRYMMEQGKTYPNLKVDSKGPIGDKLNRILKGERVYKLAYGGNLNNKNLEQNMLDINLFSDGGNLETKKSSYGLDFTNGVKHINTGGTHEDNPYEGIQMGMDQMGVPNLVEEGEVVFNDYVFSNRLNPTKQDLGIYKLPEKYDGLTFAEIAKKVSEESEERPNDPISMRGLNASMAKLVQAQEDVKMRQELDGAQEQLDSMPLGPSMEEYPQEDMMQEDMGQEEMMQDEIMQQALGMAQGGTQFADGGGLYGKNSLWMQGTENTKFPVLNPKYSQTPDLTVKSPFETNNVFGIPKDSPLYNIDLSNTSTNINTPNNTKEKTRSGSIASHLRYAPVVGSTLSVIGDLTGLTNKPKYDIPDTLTAQANRLGKVQAPAIGDYMKYDPLDTDYMTNKLQAQAGATRSGIMDSSGGNRANAQAALLAADSSYGEQLGNIQRQAKESNLAQRAQVSEFNRGTNSQNAQLNMQAQLANQQRDQMKLQATTQRAQMIQQLEDRANQARSANLTNFFNNLGGIGREEFSRNAIMNNPALMYALDRIGNVFYKQEAEDNKDSKTKKDKK